MTTLPLRPTSAATPTLAAATARPSSPTTLAAPASEAAPISALQPAAPLALTPPRPSSAIAAGALGAPPTGDILDAGHVFDPAALRELCESLGSPVPDGLETLAQNPAALSKFAMECAAQDGSQTAKHIAAFGFTDQRVLVAVARKCCDDTWRPVPMRYLVNFGIEEPATLLALLRRTLNLRDAFMHDVWSSKALLSLVADPQERVELALLGLAKGRGVAEQVAQLQISDPAQLLRLADAALPRYAADLVVSWFKEPSESVRLALAKLVARGANAAALEAIAQLKIERPEDRLSLARLCTLNCHDGLPDMVRILDLPAGAPLRNLATLLAEQGELGSADEAATYGVTEAGEVLELAKKTLTRKSHWITTFGITDPSTLAALLRFAAEHQSGLGHNLQAFGPIDAALRSDLARISAQHDPNGVAQYIAKWDLAPAAKLDVLRICAKGHSAMARYADTWNLDSQEALVELATLCAAHPNSYLPYSMRLFGIQDPAARANLLRLCVANNAQAIDHNIAAFAVTDDAALREAFEFCVKRSKSGVFSYWKAFGIADRDFLVRMASLTAQAGGDIKSLMPHLASDDPAWFTLLMTQLQHHRDKLRDFEPVVRALSADKRDALADHVANTPFGCLGYYMPMFAIENPLRRLALARIAAVHQPHGTADNLEDFALDNAEAKREIMRICVAKGTEVWALAGFLHAQKDDALTFELSMLSAQVRPLKTAQYFGHLPLTDPVQRIAVLKKCVTAASTTMPLVFIEPADMGDLASQRELITLALEHVPESLKASAVTQRDEHLSSIGELAVRTWSQAEAQAALERALADNLHTTGLQWLPAFLGKISDTFAQEQVTVRAAAALMVQRMWLSDAQLQHFNDNAFIKAILSTHAPERIVPHAAFMARTYQDGAAARALASMPTLRLEAATPFGLLVRAFLAPLAVQGVDVEGTLNWLQKPSVYRTFKDAPKVRVLLDVLIGIHGANCPAERKTALLAAVASYSDIKSLTLMFQLGESALLAQTDLLPKALGEAAIGRHVDITRVDNFMYRVAETFGKSHAPDAAWQLLAKAEATGEEAVKESFQAFFFAVLTGSLEALRADNAHVRALEALQPGVVQAYTSAQPTRPVQVADGNTGFDAAAWLQRAIFAQYHLRSVDVVFLQRHILAKDPTARAALAQSVEMYGEDAGSTLEAALFALLDAQGPQAQVAALTAVHRALGALPGGGGEFAHDILSQRAAMQRSETARPKPLEAIDTCDPHMVLRAGSDVAGSCQRLDGNPHLNKGLHGYLMHAQTRMSAVVEVQSRRIVARAMTRLLSDGTQPVLFEEPVYGDERYSKDVRAINLAKAKAMNLPLLEYAANDRGDYSRDLTAHAGTAAYEYSDAVRGLRAWGEFKIPAKNIRIIWMPEETPKGSS